MYMPILAVFLDPSFFGPRADALGVVEAGFIEVFGEGVSVDGG
jgi:hypothetical protein